MTDISTLVKGIEELNIELNKEQIDCFALYKELLKEWNQKINITSITDDVEIDIKHFLDSLTPIVTDLFNGSKSLIDIGTGGGFPGLPLKIYNNKLQVTLLDSLNKRIIFLKEVIKSLELEGITPIHARAEELARKAEYRQQYDICISRAVAALDTLSEYCLPFVKVGGYFISMKGPDVEEELKDSQRAIDLLGGKLIETKILTLPQSDIKHSLIVIKKIRGTSTKYPRGGGKPKNKPL